MGIPALWKLLGDGEVVSMATLASRHYEATGQAFRVAIDEAGWRFKNLTPAQVEQIRQKEPAANPIEKAIFWRICRLMRAHIHPVFVFDGPGRPWKRGRRGGGKVDYERTRLLVKLLDRMRIPHHRAPGEAEAECARMQQLGVVDAVWSDDADSLMFGATVLIKDHRKGKTSTAKHENLVQVYRMSEILDKVGLDAPAIVAYVTIVGGDYDVKGLLNCGEETVNKMGPGGQLRRLGRTLCTARCESDLSEFRRELMQALAEVRKRIPIPADFPRWLAVKNYKSPKVSSDEQIGRLPIQETLSKPINHDKLRELLRDRFNIWSKGYLKYIGPLLLLRELSATEAGQEWGNSPLAMSVVKQRKQGNNLDAEDSHEIKIHYRPMALMSAAFDSQPAEEDWSVLGTKDGPFDPSDPMELETLRCLVVRGKGRAAFDTESVVLGIGHPRPGRKRTSVVHGGDRNITEVKEPKAKRARQAAKPSNEQSASTIERGRRRRMQQREVYNASRGNTNANAEGSLGRPQSRSTDVELQSKDMSVMTTMSIDLTQSEYNEPLESQAPSIFRRPPPLPAPPAQKHPNTPISGATARQHSTASPKCFIDDFDIYDDAGFEAETLAAIQQSLVQSNMLANNRPFTARQPMDVTPVNVRVQSQTAKSLLLSPRSAVPQRWVVEQDALANTAKAPPAFIDLTAL